VSGGPSGRLWAFGAIVVLVLLFGAGLLEFWTDAIWYGSVGFDSVFWTRIGAGAALFVGVTVLAQTIGTLAGAGLVGRTGELGAGNLPVLWLNAFLLFAAFAAISLAASVSFDRLTPALGLSLAVVLVAYFLDVIGQLWPDAAFLQPYSLFHYLDARAALSGLADPADFAVLAAVIAAAVGYALIVFPRRDLAAPA
jgi:hypothetical protein